MASDVNAKVSAWLRGFSDVIASRGICISACFHEFGAAFAQHEMSKYIGCSSHWVLQPLGGRLVACPSSIHADF